MSFLGVLLELLAVTANGAYSFSQGFPFAAYGESVFMSLQVRKRDLPALQSMIYAKLCLE